MSITVEEIEARLGQLREERDRALAQFNALVGAINDCDYWLARARHQDEVSRGADALQRSSDRTGHAE